MNRQHQKGAVLLLVLLIVSVLMLTGVALMQKVLSAAKLSGVELHRVRALYIAEAGAHRAQWRLGLEPDLTNVPPADSLYVNEPFGGGAYTVNLSERTPTEATIRSSGTYASLTRTISVRIRLGTQWWNPTWGFRRPVVVSNNTGSDLGDYQVRIVIPYESGKMNADFSDLRFIEGGTNELAYWIEAVEPVSAIIWVRVPLIPAGGQATIEAYYGNTSALPASDITATMEPEYVKYDIAATWTSRTSVASIASGDNVGAWVDLPFTFPYYLGAETRCYACSNGYIAFGRDYNDDRNDSSNKLRQRSIIAALWDNLRTDRIYGVCDQPGIYVDSYSDRLLIDYEAYRRGFGFLNAAALFQVTLFRSGDILLSRGSATNDFLLDETVGVSSGTGSAYVDVTSESQPDRSWLFAMRKYVEPEPGAVVGSEETPSPTLILYWKEES